MGMSTAHKLNIVQALRRPALYGFAGLLLPSMVGRVTWSSVEPSGVIFMRPGTGGLIYRIHAVRERCSLHLRAIRSDTDKIDHTVITLGPSAVPISGSDLTRGQTLALIELSEAFQRS